MQIKFIALLILFFSSMSSSANIINVMNIVGKNEIQVADMLGTPTGCSKSKHGRKCSYAKAETEIMFIRGKADWITIEGIDNVPFNNNALKYIGITPKAPTFSNNFMIRWTHLQTLKEVTLFKGQKNSGYVYIKAFSK